MRPKAPGGLSPSAPHAARSTTFVLTVLGALAAVLAAALYVHREASPPHASAPATPARAVATSTPQPIVDAARPAGSRTGDAPPAASVGIGWREAVANTGERFVADAQGRLVLSEKTRQRIEALLALVEPEHLAQAVAEETRHLPPEAAQQARDLVERFRLYLEEQIAVVPPGHAPAHEDEALAQLEAMERLRIARFGAATAKALFGNETAVTRELIELMRLEKDPTLTLEQKAERAQARYSQLRQGRESAQPSPPSR